MPNSPERPPSRRTLRRVALGVAAAVAFAAVPGGVLAVSAAGFEHSRYAPPGPRALDALADAVPPRHDPARPTAVVLVGNRGANVSDALVPYELLAGTGAFNVYVVAPQRRPSPLLGGLDVVPDLSLDELDARLAGAPPAVTVVPEMPDTGSGTRADDAPVTDWLRDRASRGLVLGVCTGARLLAEAGLLDGRRATSHWYRLGELERDHPDVRWQRGVRYVDEGDLVTTGGLLSSVDGTLRVIERMLGPGTAADTARRAGWLHYAPGVAAALPPSGLTPERALTHVLDLGFRSAWTTVGVALTDGVGEIDLAAAFGPYSEVKAARMLAIASDGHPVRSRHGLTFSPRAGPAAVSGVDTLVVPASAAETAVAPVLAAARTAGTPVERPQAGSGFAFGAALQVMARTLDQATARWSAVILELPPEDVRVDGPRWPWLPAATALALGLAAAGVVLATPLVVRRARDHPGTTGAHPSGSTSPSTQPAGSS